MDDSADPTVLLTVEHALGRAALCRSDTGSPCVTADLDGAATPDQDEAARIQDDGGPASDILHSVEALAGSLPPGATKAYVRDVEGDYHSAAVGEGFWLAAVTRGVRFRALSCLFRDGDGRIVPRTQPVGAVRRPLDARERCPACDGEAWDRVTRPRGAGPRDVSVCRTCGYDVFATPDPAWLPGELPTPPRWMRRAGEAAGKAVVAGAAAWVRRELRSPNFPLYGLARRWTGSRYVAGGGTGIGLKPYVFELGHGARPGGDGPFVLVASARTPRADRERLLSPESAEATLEEGIEDLDPPERGPLGTTEEAALRRALGEMEDDRAVARRVLRAAHHTLDISVDGRPVEFAAVDDGALWAAAAQIGEVAVTILGRDFPVESTELSRLEDVSDYAI